MTFLAIDPGRDTGWCTVDERGEVTACSVGHPIYRPDFVLPRAAIIEKPKVYPARNSKGDPNDLITLAVQVGTYVGVLKHLGVANVLLVEPREWKGTLPKEIHHPRVWSILSAREQTVVTKAMLALTESIRHNGMDAVGLAKWAFTNRRFNL